MKYFNQLTDELLSMGQFEHPNIVTFFGFFCSGSDVYIVNEFMSQGSVNELLHNQSVVFEKEHIRKICLECCKGMAFLHNSNIIHGDLKCHNILIDNDWRVKVADYNITPSIIKEMNNISNGTIFGWDAPEVLTNNHYSIKSDIYSFAVCLWEMFSRQDPYVGMTAPQVLELITEKNERLIIPKLVPPVFVSIIEDCWSPDPKLRPEFMTLLTRLEAIQLPEPMNPNPYEMSSVLPKSLSQRGTRQNIDTNDDRVLESYTSDSFIGSALESSVVKLKYIPQSSENEVTITSDDSFNFRSESRKKH